MSVIPTRVLLTAKDDLVATVRSRALEQGWLVDREYEPDESGQPLEIVFTIPGVPGEAHFVDDHHAGFAYMFGSGEDVADVLAAVRATFDTVSDKVIVEALDSESEYARADGIVALALRAQEVKPAVLQGQIEAFARDPSPTVRAATVLAMGYLEDQRWLPILDELASDPDEHVAAEAARIGEGLRLYGA